MLYFVSTYNTTYGVLILNW